MSQEQQASLWYEAWSVFARVFAYRAMPSLGGQAGLSQRFFVEVGRLGEAFVDPGIHDADPVRGQLHAVDPDLEVVVMAQRVDLVLTALDQDEAAQLSGLRFED